MRKRETREREIEKRAGKDGKKKNSDAREMKIINLKIGNAHFSTH